MIRAMNSMGTRQVGTAVLNLPCHLQLHHWPDVWRISLCSYALVAAGIQDSRMVSEDSLRLTFHQYITVSSRSLLTTF